MIGRNGYSNCGVIVIEINFKRINGGKNIIMDGVSMRLRLSMGVKKVTFDLLRERERKNWFARRVNT